MIKQLKLSAVAYRWLEANGEEHSTKCAECTDAYAKKAEK